LEVGGTVVRAATDTLELLGGATRARDTGVCHACGSTVHVRTPHTWIDGSVVRLFCSDDCRHGRTAQHAAAPPRGLWLGRWLVIGVGVASLSPVGGPAAPFRAAMLELAAALAPASDPEASLLPEHGPWPPTESELALQFVAGVSDDTWVHPLPGPARRMPLRESRAFGAERAGDRPAECRSGHCGVDLGDAWGEPVYAVTHGVVEKVEHRPKPNGGRYVRLAHRDGTVITQYFHLAAIPPRLAPGVEVRAGELIGLVGESGVENSGPHLHFGVAVRPDGDPLREVYVDPEPLVALWPLKVPLVGQVQVSVKPGVPQGATGTRRARRAKAKRPQPDGN
jgi:murein DD-endopeptidase MepM/ murein hydrolase activator NlpD